MENLQHSQTVVASITAAEVCKLPLREASPLRNPVLNVDLLHLTFDNVLDASELNTNEAHEEHEHET
jgi:hypothetical protein